MSNKTYPCLWFDGQAKEAADYYCGIIKDSRIISENPVVVNFELNGIRFMALNGGPHYKFTPATSFVIECKTQEEIDYHWEKLGEGGRYDRCGWLDDKFGVSWQIVPSVLNQLMSDPERAPRVMEAFMKMSKFDIKTLEEA
jgi:predicted 3-demethylubiquinone-9 3-methyltransferase (glyoxalase superfamily)